MSKSVVPSKLPVPVTFNPLISRVVFTPETVPETVIAAPFVLMPSIVSDMTEPGTVSAPAFIETEFPVIF